MFHFERADVLVLFALVFFCVVIVRYKPSLESIHSIVEMANTKGGIIMILAAFSVLFFISGLHLSYWGIQLQQSHPNDPSAAQLNAVFNWISGGCFMGAFGAMIATMKGEPVPSPSEQKTEEVKTTTVTTTPPPVVNS